MHADTQWVMETYDRIIASGDESTMKLADARIAFLDAYETAVATGELDRMPLDVRAEADVLFEAVARPTRQARKNSLYGQMEYIVAALHDETVLGLDDPALMQAYPLGDGRDKILMFWSADDWQNATLIRYRKASESTSAAAIFDELAAQIIAAMRTRSARTTAEDLLHKNLDA